jgi:plastocyanin
MMRVRLLAEAVALALFCGACIAVALDALASGPVISQQGRAFHPGEVTIARGQELRILNDDGLLLHHVYVDAPGLRFDSDEMEPGQVVAIRFARPGRYTVLCRIHPRMRLDVTVR